jgi:hypothetical protein
MLLIAISIFLVFILYPKEAFLYSDTILGKMMAIFIIVYCTYENIIYGLFACIIIIWFYQSDMLNRYNYKLEESFTSKPQAVYSTKEDKDLQSIPTLDPLSLDKVYPTELSPLKTESETIFRNQFCSEELDLMYKNTKILRKENIQTLFPEISFANNNACNPCDSSCRFRKINKETELMAKSARGNNESICEWATSWFIGKTEPYQGIGYVASYFL